MVEIKITDDVLKRVEKYIKDGRFKNKDDFFQQAATLMLYAEDSKDEFTKIIKDGQEN